MELVVLPLMEHYVLTSAELSTLPLAELSVWARAELSVWTSAKRKRLDLDGQIRLLIMEWRLTSLGK